MSVIDGATRAVTATMPVGTARTGWRWTRAPTPSTSTNISDGTVSVIDGATRTVTATVAVGDGPVGVAVDPAVDTVYVTRVARRHRVGDRRGDPRRHGDHPRRTGRAGWRWTRAHIVYVTNIALTRCR